MQSPNEQYRQMAIKIRHGVETIMMLHYLCYLQIWQSIIALLSFPN